MSKTVHLLVYMKGNRLGQKKIEPKEHLVGKKPGQKSIAGKVLPKREKSGGIYEDQSTPKIKLNSKFKSLVLTPPQIRPKIGSRFFFPTVKPSQPNKPLFPSTWERLYEEIKKPGGSYGGCQQPGGKGLCDLREKLRIPSSRPVLPRLRELIEKEWEEQSSGPSLAPLRNLHD